MVSEILGPDLFGPEGMPLVSHNYISYLRPFTTLPRSEMRRLFEIIKKLVERRYQDSEVMAENRDLQWQSVSAFCFLRFIVPAILHPHLFGLCPGMWNELSVATNHD